MIVSNKWMSASYGAALRRFIAEKTTIQQIVDFGSCQSLMMHLHSLLS
jgi:hypothetical protein